MSDLLALAAVTAILKRSLENELVARSVAASVGGDVLVSALPPDRVATGSDERAQLNLFLYGVTPHTGLRRPERSAPTGRPAPRGTLSLELHYLVTAYGAQDFQIELLIGYALAHFQARPRFRREEIRAVLAAFAATGVADGPTAALAASQLAERVEQIEVNPQFLPTDELARLWSALQARFRPSLAYKVSAVVVADEPQPA